MDMAWLIPVLIVVALIVIVGVYLWATYNSLVALNVRVDEAWSDITVQLKRRADLLPNLIETVKGYAAHEKAVFENVTRARARRALVCAREHVVESADGGDLRQRATPFGCNEPEGRVCGHDVVIARPREEPAHRRDAASDRRT